MRKKPSRYAPGFPRLCVSFCVALIALDSGLIRVRSAEIAKPVLLYSRHFNALGETRYLPDGSYREILTRLARRFEVRVDRAPLTPPALEGVDLVLISNPSDKAAGDNPPPPHVSPGDIEVIEGFVKRGGGLIVMGNQEHHNLETKDMNRLLARFGLRFVNRYTDAKALEIPASAPIIGGLRWAYYTGNLAEIAPGHPAKPRAVVTNDLTQRPLGGRRDQAGILLAASTPGRGRVVLVTDAGWVNNSVLAGRGLGGVVIQGDDNGEIFLRLCRWAAGVK